MSNANDIVLATVRKHRAEAELVMARLESQERCVPATIRGSTDMLRLSKRIREAAAIVQAWREAEGRVAS